MSGEKIPDDVMQVARTEASLFADWLRAGNSAGTVSPHAVGGLADSFARAIMAERAAERERCADIASEHAKAHCSGTGSETEAMRLRARSIAAAIRGER